MSWFLIILSAVFVAWALRLIPTTLAEARSPLAPYRAVLGVLYFLVGLIFWAGGIGVKIVLGVSP